MYGDRENEVEEGGTTDDDAVERSSAWVEPASELCGEDGFGR